MDESFQIKFMDAIVAKHEKRADAIEAICSVLDLGKDSVYRRLRGETFLTPGQLVTLAKHYHISLDTLAMVRSDELIFKYNAFSSGLKDFEQFLLTYMKELELAHQVEGYKFYYASVELPLFQALFFPELIAFKLFIWGRTALELEFVKDLKFDFSIIPHPVVKLIEKMRQLYIGLPSTELWSQNIIDNTLNQIEYYVSCASFKNDEDALALCDKLIELTNHMQQMAQYGLKFAPGQKGENATGATFDLYHNEMVHTNNTILSVLPDTKVLFTTLGNPNFLKSTDQQICNYIEGWFKRIIAKSNSISSHAEKNREWFFNRLRRKIEQSKQRIKSEILLAE